MSVAVADQVLDDGAVGLGHFDVWLPLRARAAAIGGGGGYEPMEASHARARYDEQRGMSFAALEADAQVLVRVATTLEQQRGARSEVVATLTDGWRGAGGRAAGEHVVRLDRAGDAVSAAAAALVQAYRDAAGELREHVRVKANRVRDLDTGRVGGHDPPTVERMIDVADGAATSSTNDVAIVAIAPALTGVRPAELTPGTRQPVIDAAQEFLDRVVVPTIEAQWHDFIAVCDTAHEGCLRSYEVVVAAAAALDVDAFPLVGAPEPAAGAAQAPLAEAAPVHSTAVGWLHHTVDPAPDPAPALDLPPHDTAPARPDADLVPQDTARPGDAGTGAELASVSEHDGDSGDGSPEGTGARLAGVDAGPLVDGSGVDGPGPALLDGGFSGVFEPAFAAGSASWASIGAVLAVEPTLAGAFTAEVGQRPHGAGR